MASAGDGSTAVVWDEMSSGERRIVMRKLTGTNTLGDPRVLGQSRAVYPSIAAVSGGFVVAWTGQPGELASRTAWCRWPTPTCC